MFDCVLPTRNARNGQAFTNSGRLVIKQTCYKDDPRPIEENCQCPTCTARFGRAYLRHLYMSREILSHRLLTLHNLHFYGRRRSTPAAPSRTVHSNHGRQRSLLAGRARIYSTARPVRGILNPPMTHDKKPIGRILLEQRSVSAEELDRALTDKTAAGRLATRLTQQGVIDDVEALKALSEQHGIPGSKI